MARKKRISKKLFDDYLELDEETKLQMQEIIFEHYFENSQHILQYALEDIRNDLEVFEINEQYERCQMLNDILKKFE